MKIKDIELKNNLILAPMAGVSDVGFRALAVLFGADYAVTEMISAKGLYYDNQKTQDLLITTDIEKIKVVQIFGSDPDIMAQMCASEYLSKFDVIDINMGCPAPKVTKNKEGSALMTDIDLAYKIVKKCVEATTKPITVKFRKGWDDNNVNAIEFAKMCEKAGASAITVHARTQSQGYSGSSDLEIIKLVKQAVSIPVIGNGDVTSYEKYKNMLDYTNCDAVMIGRGAMGKPWVFSELLGKKPQLKPYETVEKHVELLLQHYPTDFVVKHMKKHFLWYLASIKNGNAIKQEVLKLETIDEVMKLLKTVL